MKGRAPIATPSTATVTFTVAHWLPLKEVALDAHSIAVAESTATAKVAVVPKKHSIFES